MKEIILEEGLRIDDADNVLWSVEELCGRTISGMEVIKKFIDEEKNTKFFLDKNLNSYLQRQPDCLYAWLDTGFLDRYGNPILISLLKKTDGYAGHFVGTVSMLSENIRDHFRLNRGAIRKKVDAFQRKYALKSEERRIRHILNEQSYLTDCIHQFTEVSEISLKIKNLGICFENIEEDRDIELLAEKEEEITEKRQAPDFTRFEEEITVGLLLEKMESMQSYMDELLKEIETLNNESEARIAELQEKNREYKRALVEIRTMTGNEKTEAEEEGDVFKTGHSLLGNHGKILVIGGGELGINVMYGIAKIFGFEKRDFEFVDYEKAKDFTDRIRRDGRYSAIIIGSCPHKVSAGAGYSSAVEKFKQTEGMPYTADARNRSGKLKITKESFKQALSDIYCVLKTKTMS